MAKSIFIIGGGPAGFFSAIAAGGSSASGKIIILEKLPSVLGKVKISGGGRCNVTNAITDPKEFIKFYPRGGKKLLNVFFRFGSKETIKWFENRNVKLKTEDDGRIFPVSDNSQTIIDSLISEAQKLNIEIKTGINVKDIYKSNAGFVIKTMNESFSCDSIIITTGSNPRIWEIIASLGHKIIEPVPSLFTFNLLTGNGSETFNSGISKQEILKLAGISVPQVEIKIKGTQLNANGPILITHWGFSGPAILMLSSFGALLLNKTDYKFELIIKWIPGYNNETLRNALLQIKSRYASKKIISHPPFEIPRRLWGFFLNICEVNEDKNWNDLSTTGLNRLVEELIGGKYNISGKSTYKEEFVTAGGVDLAEIDLNTMESKLIKGLFFAGEVMNIDGITGGFNFQSAWSTGYIAGISQKS